MIHLGHVFSSDSVLLDMGGLPINVAISKTNGEWSASYFHDEYPPEEGDFIAPAAEHALLQLTDDVELQVFVLRNGDLVTVNLDDGFQSLPFWQSRTLSAEFQNHLAGYETLITRSLGEIRLAAKIEGIWFLAPNFLSESVDHALIV